MTLKPRFIFYFKQSNKKHYFKKWKIPARKPNKNCSFYRKKN